MSIPPPQQGLPPVKPSLSPHHERKNSKVPIWVWLLISASGLCFLSFLALGFFSSYLNNSIYGEPLVRGTPQSQEAIYDRLMMEYIMAERSVAEENPESQEAQDDLKVLQRDAKVLAILDAADQELMNRPISALTSSEYSDLTYRYEAAHALDFALGYIGFDPNFDVFYGEDWGTLEMRFGATDWPNHKAKAKLRSEIELEVARRKCEAVLWRTYEEIVARDSDLVRLLNSAAYVKDDLRQLKRHFPELDWHGDDFKIQGNFVKEMAKSDLEITYYVALERWQALTWVLGYGKWKEQTCDIEMRWLSEKPLKPSS